MSYTFAWAAFGLLEKLDQGSPNQGSAVLSCDDNKITELRAETTTKLSRAKALGSNINVNNKVTITSNNS